MCKARTFADGNINVAKMKANFSEQAENMVGNGENADNKHFLLFPPYFQKLFQSLVYLLYLGLTLSKTTNFLLFQN